MPKRARRIFFGGRCWRREKAATVPIEEDVLVALVDAAKLSTAQSERIAQSELGVSLVELSSASTPAEQAKDLIAYAVQYDMVRQLAAAFLYTGADKPGLQNLLLGEDMEQAGSKQQDGNTYIMLRIENKVDNISLRLDNFEQRMRTVEAAQATKVPPVSSSDRLIFLLFTIALIAMLAYNIWGRVL